MMEMFSTMLSPQERDMGRWINQNGGEMAVLGNDKKCAAMIKYEASLAPSTVPTRHAETKGRPGSDDETKAIAALRKEYREDIQGIIQESLESYSKRFAMGLDDLEKDLGNKIQHQGNRLIKYLRGGPARISESKTRYVARAALHAAQLNSIRWYIASGKTRFVVAFFLLLVRHFLILIGLERERKNATAGACVTRLLCRTG
jgi:hypothetical protein